MTGGCPLVVRAHEPVAAATREADDDERLR